MLIVIREALTIIKLKLHMGTVTQQVMLLHVLLMLMLENFIFTKTELFKIQELLLSLD